ncbi:hypothetical protein [Brevundimonas sp. P7753]|uniref:hypothetical protein n=1 Tax=Brevundimonas sp. P7753 TaxID=2726982 RepID=UPI0015BCDD12|nr:hypothetical protein [Brevundimonas sp. P7753]NWE53656.1 hypothetical protein [Brevundimonas sp. P7753]
MGEPRERGARKPGNGGRRIVPQPHLRQDRFAESAIRHAVQARQDVGDHVVPRRLDAVDQDRQCVPIAGSHLIDPQNILMTLGEPLPLEQ